MTKAVVVRRVPGSPGDVSCKTPIIASQCRWNMSSPSSVPLKFQNGHLSNTKEISDGDVHERQGVNGGLFGLGGINSKTRHGGASMIPSGQNRRSPEPISEVNVAVKQCHVAPITITWPIPFAELRWTTFKESGFDTGERQRHQQCWLVCATNNYFNQERSTPVIVLHWRSGKLTRKAGSPQLVEIDTASSAVVEMTWIKALWESMTWRDFDMFTQRRSSRPLKHHDAACDTKRKTSLL